MPTSLTDSNDYYSTLAQDPVMGELVELFVEEMPAKMAAFQAAAASQNWETLRTLAHQLKGAAGSYGFSPLTPFAKALEFSIAENNPEFLILLALDQLLEGCSRVRAGTP